MATLLFSEEMVSSTNNIYWSPDSKFLAYLITNDTNVEKIMFSKYGNLKYPKMVKQKTTLIFEKLK